MNLRSTQSVLARMTRMRDFNDWRTEYTNQGVATYGPIFHRIKSLALTVIQMEIDISDQPEIVHTFMTHLAESIDSCREDVILRK